MTSLGRSIARVTKRLQVPNEKEDMSFSQMFLEVSTSGIDLYRQPNESSILDRTTIYYLCRLRIEPGAKSTLYPCSYEITPISA
jgi:hypothetical protein